MSSRPKYPNSARRKSYCGKAARRLRPCRLCRHPLCRGVRRSILCCRKPPRFACAQASAAARRLFLCRPRRCRKFVLRNFYVLRAVPDFKPIGVCVAHGVVFEFQVFNAVEIQCAAERNRRLRVLTPVCGRIVRGVLESDSANRKPRKRSFRRLSASRQKASRHGIVRRNVFGRLAVARVVPEGFSEGVEIESAPFVERGENVSDAQPRIFVPLGKRNRQGVADFQRSRLSVGIARYVEKPAVGVYQTA